MISCAAKAIVLAGRLFVMEICDCISQKKLTYTPPRTEFLCRSNLQQDQVRCQLSARKQFQVGSDCWLKVLTTADYDAKTQEVKLPYTLADLKKPH
jgi:hypothetical protein